MNENEFELDGKVYVALPANGDSCYGCSFINHQCRVMVSDMMIPDCNERTRNDKKNVIFMEKPQ